MIERPSIFVLQIIVVTLVTAFHLLAARSAVRRMRAWRRPVRRVAIALLVVLLLFLDLPLVHSFILYKFYHPQGIDDWMHDWATLLVTAHANAALFGSIAIAVDYVAPWVRRRMRGVARAGRALVGRGAPAHAEVPAETAAVKPPEGRPVEMPMVFTRRRFITQSGLALAGLATSATTLSAMESTDEYRQEQVVVKIPNLPEKLKGTTIALISDVHSSVFMTREEMDRYVAALNAMKADVAIVAGDFVNSKLREVYPFCESFTALKAPLGVYGVTGNHDYYTGEIEQVAREVEQCGIKLLRNSNLPIEKDGERFWLMGIDDGDIYDVKPYLESGKTERGTIENMVKGIPNGAARILICHKPYPFEEYSSLGMDLMLSGHTHGGQVVIAQLDNINLSFATLASRYIAGLYRSRTNRTSQMYVSRGVGTVGLPLRLNCPPEITRIVLV